MKVHLVGDILVNGTGATKYSVCGNVCVCRDEDDVIRNFRKGDILVIPQTTNDILSYLKDAAGIITEMDGLTSHASIVGLALEKPVIVGALNATKILKSGTTVTMEAGKGLVYSGNIKRK